MTRRRSSLALTCLVALGALAMAPKASAADVAFRIGITIGSPYYGPSYQPYRIGYYDAGHWYAWDRPYRGYVWNAYYGGYDCHPAFMFGYRHLSRARYEAVVCYDGFGNYFVADGTWRLVSYYNSGFWFDYQTRRRWGSDRWDWRDIRSRDVYRWTEWRRASRPARYARPADRRQFRYAPERNRQRARTIQRQEDVARPRTRQQRQEQQRLQQRREEQRVQRRRQEQRSLRPQGRQELRVQQQEEVAPRRRAEPGRTRNVATPRGQTRTVAAPQAARETPAPRRGPTQVRSAAPAQSQSAVPEQAQQRRAVRAQGNGRNFRGGERRRWRQDRDSD